MSLETYEILIGSKSRPLSVSLSLSMYIYIYDMFVTLNNSLTCQILRFFLSEARPLTFVRVELTLAEQKWRRQLAFTTLPSLFLTLGGLIPLLC